MCTDALRQRLDRNKRCREEKAALHAREVHELADRWMDRPVERVPRQVAARITEEVTTLKKSCIVPHPRTLRPRYAPWRDLQYAASQMVPSKEYPNTSAISATPLKNAGLARTAESDTVPVINPQSGCRRRASSSVRGSVHTRDHAWRAERRLQVGELRHRADPAADRAAERVRAQASAHYRSV